MRLRDVFARLTGRTMTQGQYGPAREGEGFRTFVALMIALVTIAGAVVAWRSALAGVKAGNSEDAGLLASLNRQEAISISTMLASQHRATYLQYTRYHLMASLAAVDGRLDNGTPDEILAKVRPIVEQFDLATTHKRFFPSQHIRQGDLPDATGTELTQQSVLAEANAQSYDIEREIAQSLAETSRNRDVEPDPKFAEADRLRDQSTALVATLILLACALWFFAFAESVSHWIKYVWGAGGLAFLIIGSVAAWAIEAGFVLSAIYSTAEMASFAAGIAVAVGAIVGSIFFLIGRSRKPANISASDGDDSPSEHRFKQAVTTMIASVALFAAIVGWLQADSSAKGDLGIRNAQRFATEALGTQAAGEANVNYNFGGAAVAWKEMDVLLANARAEGDEAGARIFEAVREHIAGQSELLSNSNYFDPATDSLPFLEAFQSETYLTKKTELVERSRIEGELNNAWEDKANTYIIHLTLLAASLALFGLSMTFSGLARPVFVFVGLALAAVTVGSVYSTFSSRVAYTPDSAVAAYAAGIGAQHRYDWDGALEALDEATAQAPAYANAYYERGNAQYFKANYEAAVDDFQAARNAGRDDSNLAWNLGWSYYLLGQFDEAIAESHKAYDLDRNSFGARLNAALALLAQGKLDEARGEYDQALEDVTQEVEATVAAGREIAPSVWFYLEAGATDLESLNDALLEQPRAWTQAPPRSSVQDPDRVREVAEEIFVKIKSLNVALETTGKRSADVPTVEVGDLRFGIQSSEDETTFSEGISFKPDAGEIYTLFTHSGLGTGRKVIMKVYLNGVESPQYRQVMTSLSDDPGEEALSFTSDFSYSNAYKYDPGDYTIELYVDAHLFRRSSFTIEQQEIAE